jgi:hypothetical protein
MDILLVDISAYWCLLRVIILIDIILLAIGAYYINGYW